MNRAERRRKLKEKAKKGARYSPVSGLNRAERRRNGMINRSSLVFYYSRIGR